MRWLEASVGCACAFLVALQCWAADPDQEKLNTAVDALTRLENVNLDEKPAVKAAVQRVLDRTRGTPNFVKLVQHFRLTNQNPGLVEVAVNHPEDESGVAAMRLILASGDLDTIKKAAESTNATAAARVVQAAGNAKEKKTTDWLQSLVTDDKRAIEVRRAAIRGLAQTQEGATALLKLAQEEKLADTLRFVTASELNAVRWPEIKTAAAKVLPLPAGQNAQPLPPVAELVKMKGDAIKGAEVFRRETTGCIKCHQINTEGKDVGPALSEIGTKLAREAMYESILDPSAGISFGFEAWQLELKSGDEAYGLKASDAADEIAIKDVSGIITRYKKSELASLKQSKTSIMPTGLQQVLSTQELVDLVEYLASLKKQSDQ